MSLFSRCLRRSAVSLLGLFSGVCAAQQARPQFNVPQVQGTGGRVTSFLTSNFQHPPKLPDILWIDAPTGTGKTTSVTVGELLNNQGFFNLGENQIVFTDVSNVAAAVGDFNGDGLMDYAFALSPTVAGTTDLCVYYGTGAPSTSGNSSYSGGNLPNAYPPTGGKSGCTTFAYQGSSSPNFAYVAAIPFKTGFLPQLIVEDSANSYLYIFKNDGTTGSNGVLGSFTLLSALPIPAADGAGPIYSGDFNGDGNTDFVVNGQAGNSATVYLGNGDGTFRPPVRYTFDHNVHSMLMYDMDGDGHLDMVVEGDNGVIEIFHGNADGSFAAASEGGTAAGVNAFTGNGGHLAAIGDVNRDGNLDILTATPIGLSVLLGQGGLKFALAGIYNIGPGRTSFTLADFDGDGNLDMAVDSAEGVAIAFGDANSDGGFQTSKAYTTLAPGLGATVGKFRNAANNPKGNLDVVVATGATQAQLMTGNGDGTFHTFAGVVNNVPFMGGVPAGMWSNILSGDFDGDGNLDVAYSFTGLTLPPPTGSFSLLGVEYGNGDGTFGGVGNSYDSNGSMVTASNGNSFYVESAAGDFNGDGVADLAMSSQVFDLTEAGCKGVRAFCGGPILSGGGNTSFSLVASGFFRTGRSGQQDLVFQENANFIPYVNAEDGTGKNFTAKAALVGAAAPLYASTVLLTDVDGDGNGDLVVMYYNAAYNAASPSAAAPNQVYIWYGNGDGTFGQPEILTLSRNYYLGGVADMNGDGFNDLVLSDGSIVSILYNQGAAGTPANRSFGTADLKTGLLTGEQHFLAGQGINSISLVDVNGDTKPDLIVANGGATISNALALGGKTQASISLTPNADVNTGGITVLLNNIFTKPVTGTLVATPEPSLYQATFTMTATLTPSAGVALPTGTVAFSIDGTQVGTGTLTANGTTATATYTVAAGNTYADGNHALTASYGGDTFNTAIALSDTHVITGGPTTITLYLCVGPTVQCPATGFVMPPFSSQLTESYGQIWNGTWQVVAADGGPTPGNFELFDLYNGTSRLLCDVPNVGGTACPAAVGITQGTEVGTHILTGVYTGDTTHTGSTSSTVTINILQDTTTATSLTGGPNPSPVGQPVTFTATLAGNFAAPTGTVTFYLLDPLTSLAAPIGTGTLVPGTGVSSTATFTTSTLPVGTDSITANYAGNVDFAAATFPTIQETITPLLAGSFTLSVTPSPETVTAGYGGLVSVSVVGQNGFAQAVNLSCGNLPSEVTCTFFTNPIAAGGGSTTLIVQTTAPHTCGTTAPYFARGGSGPDVAPLALPALAGVLAIFVPGRRRWLRALTVAVVAAGAMQTIGCSTCTDLGTRPATYTIQVIGSAVGTSEVETAPLTINVTI